MIGSRLAALRDSTADLLQWLDATGWSDADAAAASLCSGWSRGHVGGLGGLGGRRHGDK